MNEKKDRLEQNVFEGIVEALMRDLTTLAIEAKRDERLPFRRGIHNETLLHFFVVESRPDLVRSLASLGADVNPENEFGNTPLMEAVIKDDLHMVKLLLELGAPVNWQSSRDKSTALHVAADYERHQIVAALIAAGANDQLRNDYEETASDLIKKRLFTSSKKIEEK